MEKETNAYCNVTYLWSFTRKDLDLPDTATDDELKEAAEIQMKELLSTISHMADIYHNDLDITIG